MHELTPYEILVGRNPILSHLKVFRSIANVCISNENQEKFDTKSEKCILVGYSSEKKAYKCFNPSTRAVWVRHDVVFNESPSLYEPDSTPSDLIEEELNAISDDDIRPSPQPKDNPSSTELSGPHEPSHDENTSCPSPKLDKGEGKMPEYEVDHPDDNDSNVSVPSLDSEFGVPIMRTLGVKKVFILVNEKLCRSSQAKNPVTWFAYNEYMAHHYAFSMKGRPNKSLKALQKRLVTTEGMTGCKHWAFDHFTLQAIVTGLRGRNRDNRGNADAEN